MGFSLTGLAIALAVLGPNLLMVLLPPREGTSAIVSAGLPFTILERAGQVASLSLLCLLPASFERAPDVWFWLMIVGIAAYWALWIRYVVRGRHVWLLFEPVLRIPIPMAIFPVLAFGCAAAWGRSIWLGIAVLVLAIGHWSNSWYSYRRNVP